MSTTERYSFSLTTFRCSVRFTYMIKEYKPDFRASIHCSPSGKLVQIEYALAAVAAGAPSVGIKASNGVVLATEKKHKSILYEEQSMHKVEMVTNHIGMVYSGMGPDYRLLVRRARKIAQEYHLMYNEEIPTSQLVQRVANVSIAWNCRVVYNEELLLDDAVHNAILTLKESFEGQMTSENIEIGISDAHGFRRLTPAEVKDYLANM
ncbi:unnamed protein product [Cyprideis torosa]|uniref:Uncharacterized protein n=1 Tax=Cyprideis torosa TaxID=163714 RepID=A0A7R8WFN9_9CRUS|nr:unnamed protein product [Cyprideis torosa]CAG0897227.1 unnamed protein product [Cyprideis torosa]